MKPNDKNIESEIANNMIGDKIRNNELFNYMRFGMGYETFIPYHIENNLELDKNILEKAHLPFHRLCHASACLAICVLKGAGGWDWH